MPDDAQTPEEPRDTTAWTPPGQGTPAAPGDGEPGSEPEGEAPAERRSPDRAEGHTSGPQPDDAPARSAVPLGSLLPSSEAEDAALVEDPEPGAGYRDAAGAEGGLPESPPQDAAPAGGPAPDPRAEQTAPSAQTSHVHLTKPPSEPRPTPNPWAPPMDTGSAGWSGGPTPPALNEPTAPGVPGASAPNAGPWANPFAPPSSSGNPFAAPAARTPYPQPAPEEHVPPPPIAPDGPGRPAYPYDYPQYAPVPPQGPYQGGHGWPPMPSAPSNGMGTAGLVLGILAAVVFCLWPLAIVLGVLGVIFGVIGRRKARRGEASNPGQALAGIICGAVGIGLGIAMLVFLIVVPDDTGSGDSGGDDGFSTALVREQP